MSDKSRFVAVAVVAVLAVAAMVWFRAASGRTSVGASGSSSSATTSDGGDQLHAPGRSSEPGVEVVEKRLRLDARLEVEVVDKKSKRPMAGVEVRASIDVRTEIQARHSFEFSRTATTGDDGVAVFDEFPRRTTVTARVRAEGFRPEYAYVMLRADESRKRIHFGMVPGLSPEQSSVRLTWPAGVALPGASVHFHDRTSGNIGDISPDVPLLLDAEPDGAPEHEVDLQLTLPGYAGASIRRRLRRGTSFELSPPRSDPVAQEIAVLDENGRGVEALNVSVWPTTAISQPPTKLSGTTDDRGVVTLRGYPGTTWKLGVDEARAQQPDIPERHPIDVGGTRATIVVGRRLTHRLVFDGKGLGERGRCELVWRSYEPTPGSALERLLRDDPVRYGDRIERYVQRLPRAVEWSRLASGGLAAELALLPGHYVLLASTDELYGRETTLEITRPGAETLMALERATRIRVRIEGSFDRSSGPLPYRTMIIAHRAQWDERAEISRVIGTEWAARAKAGPRARGSDLDESHSAHMEAISRQMARREAPLIGRDLGYVDRDGVCEIETQGPPEGVTVLFPDLQVAHVPVEGDGATFRGRVEPSSFRRVTIRVRRENGEAFADYPIGPAPLAHLRAGIREFGSRRSTDRDGVLRIGILPDESIGLHPRHDEWTVSAGAGTSVERLNIGLYPSFVITTRADAPEPSIDIVAAPGQPK